MSVHPSGMLLDESAADTKKPAVHNPLEQFVLLAKGTKGAACTDLIKTVLEAPGVYVFAELLAQPNIVEVRLIWSPFDWSEVIIRSICANSIFCQFFDSWRAHRMHTT